MCKILGFLYMIIPFKRLKGALIRKHFERCQRCSQEIEAVADAAGSALKPKWIQESPSLWPKIRERLVSRKSQPELRLSLPRPYPGRAHARRWKQAAVAALAAVIVLGSIGLFVLRHSGRARLGPGSGPPGEPPGTSPRVEVNAAELKGKPANPYIYQTPRASFIWIAPSKEIGG
jgi:hypothetical protein